MRADPDAYPFTFDGLEVVFGKTLPDVKDQGYTPEQPIIEVLTDLGLVVEPEGWWMRDDQDPSSEYYVVTFRRSEEQAGVSTRK